MKNIVICCDGTRKDYRGHPTNVAKLFRLVVRDSPQQVAFYDPGLGTHGARCRRTVEAATGLGIKRNVIDGYEFLMDWYEPKDRVFLFGFSRGAFTARSLGGLLSRSGILVRGGGNLLEAVFAVYQTRGEAADREAASFRQHFSRDCLVHFIGVWDTVRALGLPHPWLDKLNPVRHRFKDNQLSPAVRFGYHALAIDDRRKTFHPTPWDEQPTANQTVEQVWFAGMHGDVGGGYPEAGLSDISLQWMLEKAEPAGLVLKQGWRDNLRPDATARMHDSRTGWGRLFYPERRHMPKRARIHPSVRQRMDAEIGYDPELPPDAS